MFLVCQTDACDVLSAGENECAFHCVHGGACGVDIVNQNDTLVCENLRIFYAETFARNIYEALLATFELGLGSGVNYFFQNIFLDMPGAAILRGRQHLE